MLSSNSPPPDQKSHDDSVELSLRHKYWRVIKAAWNERELVKTLRKRSEMEFCLPF